MKTKKDKPRAKAKSKKSALSNVKAVLMRFVELEDRVTRLEQAQIAPIPPPQSLPEGGLPPQGSV